MKLKLEIQDSLTILSVLETIAPAQLPVLKAGINKLFQSGKKTVLLDLCAIPEDALKDTGVIPELIALPAWAIENDALLGIASPVSGVGNAATREDAIAQLNSPLNQLIAQEGRLRAKLATLQRRKSEADQRINAMGVPEAELRALRRENSDLRRLNESLESQTRELLSRRNEPLDPAEAMKTKIESLTRTLVAVLEQEGLLPVT